MINEVCLSYQKGLKSVAIKDYQLSKKVGKEAEEHFIFAQFMAENNRTQNEIKELSDELSKSIRSSSALEAKNAVLREFFNSSSGQITQGHLNLIAFYMNRKIAIRGKYKGKSPLERLTGEKG